MSIIKTFNCFKTAISLSCIIVELGRILLTDSMQKSAGQRFAESINKRRQTLEETVADVEQMSWPHYCSSITQLNNYVRFVQLLRSWK